MAEAEALEKEAKAAREAAEYEAWFRHKVQEALDSSQFLAHEEVEAETEAWCAEALREVLAEGSRSEAAEYEAWFRHKVREELDASQLFTPEEVEAETEAWCAEALKVRQRRAAKARRTVDEVGVGVRGKG